MSNPFSFAVVYCHFITTLFIAQCPFSSSAINSNSLTLFLSLRSHFLKQTHSAREREREWPRETHKAACCPMPVPATFRASKPGPKRLHQATDGAGVLRELMASVRLIFLNDNVFLPKRQFQLRTLPPPAGAIYFSSSSGAYIYFYLSISTRQWQTLISKIITPEATAK